MKPFLLFTFATLFLFSNQVIATPAPQPGDLMGGVEYSFLSSLHQDSKNPQYSDAIRLGLFSVRGLPFSVSLDAGFLNPSKQRYTRLGFFNFGKQPTISSTALVGHYYRAELLSFNWKEGGSFNYSPGLELGLTFSLSEKFGIAVFSKATLESQSTGDDKRWGQENGPQGIFWLGLSLLQMNHFKAAASPE